MLISTNQKKKKNTKVAYILPSHKIYTQNQPQKLTQYIFWCEYIYSWLWALYHILITWVDDKQWSHQHRLHSNNYISYKSNLTIQSKKKKKKILLRKVMGYRIVPLKKLADLGVFRANNLALNLESEPVGSLESQEIRSPQRDLPKHHFLSLSGTLSLNTLRLFLYLSLLLCYVTLSPILN